MADKIREPTSPRKYRTFAAEKGDLKSADLDAFYGGEPNLKLKVKGGRPNALSILEKVHAGDFKNYDYARDYPSMNKTTFLSAYIKFGCISVREAYRAFKKSYGLKQGLVRELIWREFYAHASWHFPRILNGEGYKPQPKYFAWSEDKKLKDALLKGKTGVPFVDAGIRELLHTGYMNNRARMVVASFATKDLSLDWRFAERELFGRYLVDYDPCTNANSWQGIAGVGIDAAPYWRIMNPWRQMLRFDKDCEYVKAWIPEISDLSNKQIHAWKDSHNRVPSAYPPPILDHDDAVREYLDKWKRHS